jgi:SRSO17 transposase
VYGGDRHLRIRLEEQEQPFVLTIACDEPLWCNVGLGPEQKRADKLAQMLGPSRWKRLSAGEGAKGGAKGPRLYDWACGHLCRLAEPQWEHWLLVRRSISKPKELAYHVVFAPAGTSLPTLVKVAGRRWTIEECIELAKGEVGLDQYEVRNFTGWYRHVTLALFAHAYLTVIHARAEVGEQEKGGQALRLRNCYL